MGESIKPKKIEFSPQIDLILSSDFDKREVDGLTSRITGLIGSIVGPRLASQLAVYGPEWRLLASFLYYGITLYGNGRTLGQEYTDIAPIRAVDKPYSRQHTTTTTSSRVVRYTTAIGSSPSHMVYICAVCALVPYAQSRWTGVLSFVMRQLGRNMIISPTPSVSNNTTTTISTGVPPSTTITSSPSTIPQSQSLRRVLEGVLRVWRERRPLVTQGLQRGMDILGGYHMFLFLSNGRFFELCWHIFGIRFMRKISPSSTSTSTSDTATGSLTPQNHHHRSPGSPSRSLFLLSKLQLLSLLLQMIPLVRQLLLQLLLPVLFQSSVWSTRTSTGTGTPTRLDVPDVVMQGKSPLPTHSASSSFTSHSHSHLHHHCPLCMGSLSAPACSPCGHVFCWSCIGAWMSRGTSGGGTGGRCPVCRAALTPQSLRPMYGYV
eukprot:gene3430-6806_t